ncbi:ABC transporter ATP-binding protein [Natronomonas sp. LN261]|uniref:ABC transporter ATP-binding protein n=1 Tax=Natronomonas sp. LN261 TaxID=2750669 RepID=UPI0015EF3353
MTLELEGISHRYGTETAVDGVSFGVASGELVALLGPSGCGKTTIVQAIAGHVHPTAGRIRLRGQEVTDAPPEARHVGLVFQRSTLYPHMTVEENVAYGLAARDVGRDSREAVVSEYLGLVAIEEQRDAYPSSLSGGQTRRAELARALAPQPDVLLLDEPLSALDRALRERLRDEIARIQRETGVTTLFVTHDQAEAMALADRLVVMSDGTVSGIGEPRALYESPPTPFVASFLGRSNTFPATVIGSDPPMVDVGGGTVRLPRMDGRRSPGDRITCHVRPAALSVRSADAGTAADESEPSLCGEVVRVTDVGRHYDVTVRAEVGAELIVEHTGAPPVVGDRIVVALPERGLTVFGG